MPFEQIKSPMYSKALFMTQKSCLQKYIARVFSVNSLYLCKGDNWKNYNHKKKPGKILA